ncbi:neuraminidase-like domain-containing protein [Shinella sp.]|uniref:neuraminidase-like domain-containing protein n=1 Tax=Shinella sp. TaxID=1870904 RepID=UPI003F713D32
MEKIIPPIGRQSAERQVKALQEALIALIERDRLLPSPGENREFLALVRRELGRYGDATTKAISIFQDSAGIGASGEVDARTATALNALLEELGLIDELEAKPAIDARQVLLLRLEDLHEEPVEGVLVQAFHRPADAPDLPLGEPALTDAGGRVTILFRRSDYGGQGEPGLVLALRLSRDGLPLAHEVEGAQDGVVRDLRPRREPFVVRLLEGDTLGGRLLTADGDGLAGISMRLYRLGFAGKDDRLAETISGAEGRYAFTYDRGAGQPVLEVRGLVGRDEEIKLSRPLSGLSEADRARVDLVAPSTLIAAPPEYRRIAEDLAPRIGNIAALAGAREDGGRADLTVLARGTGWDARLLATAARAQRLAADTSVGVGAEPLYALLRAGLPGDREALARIPAAKAETALAAARKAGLVALSDDEAKVALDSFSTFSRKARLAVRTPGGASSYQSMIEASGLDGTAQKAFADAFLAAPGGKGLWQAARAAGLDDAAIGRLQLQGKLALLAGNSAPLVGRLMGEVKDSPRELVAHDLHAPAAWATRILDAAEVPAGERDQPGAEALKRIDAVVPASYAGETPLARLAAYSEDMARRIRIAYPTETLARKVETGGFTPQPAADPVAKLLRAAGDSGFVMGKTPVTTFLKAKPDLVAELDPAERAVATTEMKTLQRLHQITPEDDAIPVLRAMGMTSAQDVTAMSETAFVTAYQAKHLELYGGQITWYLPRLVHRKAQQVSSIVYSLFATAQKINTQPAVAGISGPVAVHEAARDELIRHLPTLESLFGSLDFSECEHCGSVLSPTAYFVDLLQFVDKDPAIWANFVAQWEARTGKPYPHTMPDGRAMTPYDALIERRPDLPHVPLSCENTTTALPYVDVVNEVLEYFVAKGGLDAAAAHDGGGLDSATLLAEPQHVLSEAYARLRNAVYPLVLPFDQPLEQMRAFLSRMGLPLAELLDIFRPTEALFDSAAAYDRAAVFLERLALSPAEVAIYANPDPLATWFRLYGFANRDAAVTEAEDAESGQRIDLNSAKALSRRLKLTYKELTQVLQTGFVNPALGRLALLYKLGISIGNARTYVSRKALLDADPATLSPADKLVRADVQAVADRITALAARYSMAADALTAAVEAIPFGEVLVLADDNAGGNFDRTLVRHADGGAAGDIDFLRINLLVRLWRKLGWTLDETDRALTTFMPANAPYDAAHFAQRPLVGVLIQIAHLAEIAERLQPGRLGRLPILSFWSDLALTGAASPYSAVFLAPSVLAIDPVFDAPLGDYLSTASIAAHGASHVFSAELAGVSAADALDPAAFATDPRIGAEYDALGQVQHLSFRGLMTPGDRVAIEALSASPALAPLLDRIAAEAAAWGLVAGHRVAIQTALGLTAAEFDMILTEAGLEPATAPLSLAALSLLYRTRMLARLMKRSVAELLTLRRLSGIDPFATLGPEPIADLAADRPFSATLAFLDVADRLKAAGLDGEDLEELLLHRQAPERARVEAEDRAAMLRDLSLRIARIRADHAIPEDPAVFTDSVLAEKLGLVLPANVAGRFLAVLSGAAEVSAVLPVAPADRIDPALIPAGDIVSAFSYDALRQEQRLTVRGVITDAEKAALLATEGARLPAPARATFAALLDAVQAAGRAEANTFFKANLERNALDPAVASGFLDPADFPLLSQRPDPAVGDAERAARDLQRRSRLAASFLPFLQERLVRQAVEETLLAAIPTDPALTLALVGDKRLLATDPAQTIATALERVALSGFSLSVDGGAPVTVPGGDTGAKGPDGAKLRPAGDTVKLEGLLEAPSLGAYRLTVELDKGGAKAQLLLPDLARPVILSGAAAADGDTLAMAPGELVFLQPGRSYRVVLDLADLGGGEARLLIQGESLPRGPVERLRLIPAAAMAAADSATILLEKAADLATRLGLDRRDLTHLLTHPADFGGLTLSDLPTAPVDDSPAERVAAAARLQRILRLVDYARAKRDIAGGTDALITLFEAEDGGAPDRLDNTIYPLIARLTGRKPEEVKATARALFTAPAFRNEVPVLRLARALSAVRLLGAAPGDLVAWTGIIARGAPFARRFDLSRRLRETIRARLDAEGWQRLAKPIFDGLRQRQRDALVGHVGEALGLRSMEEIYEYFLIDPGMEPVVETSRIRLASASVQLFIQRCLLNLEKKVPASAIDAEQWEWMKRYRVWEANRKIFLFPENWLEPEFRDDKSPLFRELEGTLLSDDVSADMVEDAFLTYLRKLDQIARLDIVAMHLEDSADPAARILHVIGRSYGQPYAYFYRRFVHETWTAWEPAPLDIAGDHLAPVVWRGRLYLFWITFREEADVRSSGPTPSNGESTLGEIKVKQVMANVMAQAAGRRRMAVDLHWAEFSRGSWSQPEGSPPGSSITVGVSANFQPIRTFVHVSRELTAEGEGGVFIHVGGEINRAFYLAGRNSPVAVVAREARPVSMFSAASEFAGRLVGSGPLRVVVPDRKTVDGATTVEYNVETIFGRTPSGYNLLPLNSTLLPWGVPDYATSGAQNPSAVVAELEESFRDIMALSRPVFYQDDRMTFFLRPEVTETTVEEWEEWVEPPIFVPDDDTFDGGLLNGLPKKKEPWVVVEALERPFALVDPTVDPRPVDWLLNPHTAVEFDGALLGPAGQLGTAVIQAATTVPGALAQAPLAASPGSTAQVEVLAASGLTAGIGGLNVVGAGGFNRLLKTNLTETIAGAGLRGPGL